LKLPLELLTNEGDVFGRGDRRERPALRSPNILSAASLPHVIVPSLAATKLGTFTLLSVLVSSIEERFCGI
jgi:hypothetical protein